MDRGRPDREGGKTQYDIRQERRKNKEKGGGAGNSQPTGMDISVTKVQAPFLQKLLAGVNLPQVHKKRQLEEMPSDDEYDLENATGADAASQREIAAVVAQNKAKKDAEEKEKAAKEETNPTPLKHIFKLPTSRKRKADKGDPVSEEKRVKTSETKEEVKTLKPLKPWDKLELNDVIITRVKNITQFGLFADVGGVDGLLHNKEMLPRPPEAGVRRVGDVIEVRVVDIARGEDNTWAKGRGKGADKPEKQDKKIRICLSEKLTMAVPPKKKPPNLLSFDDDEDEDGGLDVTYAVKFLVQLRATKVPLPDSLKKLMPVLLARPASDARPCDPGRNVNPRSLASAACPQSPAGAACPRSPASAACPGSPVSTSNPGSPVSTSNPGSPASAASFENGDFIN